MAIGAYARGAFVAIGSFIMFGTVAALWANPLFIRMTPTGGFEVVLLALQALLLGVYVAIPVPSCGLKLASVGGIASYIGIACPVCNKLLLFVFGANSLLIYLEPMRLYLAVGGALVTMVAVSIRWRNYQAVSSPQSSLPFRDQLPATALNVL
ncbi:hypothetical protein [Manganibacter manganicus]|uniref:Uncharacterized protein n=1 Tax=Manganibacter manganicus TaxID=1873176 RepID=A0A1V8RJP9_9HYPH|nr:hypothetical protein [Pseudaminobacter manganicus]OQM73435.1 hypothetical protein BFN67_09100 [Pseudaminobacter manganicus]